MGVGADEEVSIQLRCSQSNQIRCPCLVRWSLWRNQNRFQLSRLSSWGNQWWWHKINWNTYKTKILLDSITFYNDLLVTNSVITSNALKEINIWESANISIDLLKIVCQFCLSRNTINFWLIIICKVFFFISRTCIWCYQHLLCSYFLCTYSINLYWAEAF